LRQADKLGAGNAVIIGEKELANGKVVLRDMTTARQETVTMEELSAKLQRQLY
jgi:histidyl-tRNA synthetase